MSRMGAACFVCCMLGRERSISKAQFRVRVGNGIQLCEEHFLAYATVALDIVDPSPQDGIGAKRAVPSVREVP